MRKYIFVLSLLATLFAGCTKEAHPWASGRQTVSVSVSLDDAQTRGAALTYPDGHGANVDHWVVEVKDALNTQSVYYHGEKSGEKGALTQTFDLYLVKGHTYYISFWADKAGCYTTDDLTAVKCKDVTKIGNSDDYDGFFTCQKYEVTGDATISAKLTRPFAQVNVITTDLPRLKSTTTADAYTSYAPIDYTFKLKVPTVFNAFTGEASAEEEITIVPAEGANHCYGDYAAAAEKTTMHMVYLLTNKSTATGDVKDIRNIDFAFNTGKVKLTYDFDNIPLKRNYRTNIIGSFMTNAVKWEVEVIPAWKGEMTVNTDN